jgi:tRNA modification GTPase
MLSAARDTIVALSTPPGAGAIAVVRLSGPRAFSLARQRLGEANPAPTLSHARATRRAWHDKQGRLLDHPLILAFHAPRSYTGEDLVELHLHGSPWLVGRVLADLRADVALAEPGEFTRRAVENGRMDLSQAEGVRALVEARGELAHQLALRAVSGEQGRRVRAWLDRTLDLLSLVEAELDFGEHDILPVATGELLKRVSDLRGELNAWLGSWGIGRLASGAQVVLAGPPNAGKSTLLNALAGQERVLVDAEPGTTRDAVGVELELDGVHITLWDTAGLRVTESRVERMGVEKARGLLDEADLILSLRAPGQSRLAELEDRPNVLPVETMVDQAPARDANHGILGVSAWTGEGLSDLRLAVRSRLVGVDWQTLEIVLSEARHLQLVEWGAQALARAAEALSSGLDRSLVAADVREAAEAIGGIVGGPDFDDVYAAVFARFCVGK